MTTIFIDFVALSWAQDQLIARARARARAGVSLAKSSGQNATNESRECAANMADFRHLWSEPSV